jgi:ADP-ribosylglycohydrolase
MTEPATKRDRARGALLALAAGDAVGTTLEFQPQGTFSPIDDMVGGGPFRLKPGQWTDDTSMALCLAESILDRGGMDPADQMRRYGLWRRAGYLSSNGRCFDVGITTGQQLDRFERSGAPIDATPDDDSAANGSLMRLAPVPIRWHREVDHAIEHAAASSRTTHGAPRPVDACKVLAAMTSAFIQGVPAEEVFDPEFWQWGDLHPAIDAVARGSWSAKMPPAIRGTGYCVDALEAAIWSVAGAADTRDALLRAANLGDDADTTAAIAGQLAGARWGASSLPDDWLRALALRDRIASIADGLFDATAPQDPMRAWSHDEPLHAWWVDPGALLAGEYPGHEDPAQARLKLSLLADAGIRTIIDLTEPHELEPYVATLESIEGQRQIGLTRISFPIRDFGVAGHETYDAINDTITREIAAHRPVYVHCWGGVGRTGTVIGCWLIHNGAPHVDVVATLSRMRAGTRKSDRPCPETEAQLELLGSRS